MERGMQTPDDTQADYDLLTEQRELDLLRTLSRYPEVVVSAANALEPHQVAYYLRDLATDFHTYYNAHPFLSSEAELRLARLGLIDATRQVIANGLDLLGVSAPQTM
jgi:arginyl-tRNA synthetase